MLNLLRSLEFRDYNLLGAAKAVLGFGIPVHPAARAATDESAAFCFVARFMAAQTGSRKARQFLLRRVPGIPTCLGCRLMWNRGWQLSQLHPTEAVMAHSSISVRGPIDTDAAQLLIGQLRALGILVAEPPRTWTAVDDMQYRACALASRVCRKAARRPAKTGVVA